MPIWAKVLIGVATWVIATYFLLRLIAPEILTTVLAKNLEKYKKNPERELEEFKIQAQGAQDALLAQSQHNLDKSAEEHRIRFTRLHEQRAEVIGALYGGLDRFHRAVRSMLQVISTAQDRPDGWDAALAAYRDLNPIYYENAVWLDAETCGMVNAIIDMLMTPIKELSLTKDRNRDDLARAVDKGRRIVDHSVPEARDLLDKRLREMLAVEWNSDAR